MHNYVIPKQHNLKATESITAYLYTASRFVEDALLGIDSSSQSSASNPVQLHCGSGSCSQIPGYTFDLNSLTLKLQIPKFRNVSLSGIDRELLENHVICILFYHCQTGIIKKFDSFPTTYSNQSMSIYNSILTNGVSIAYSSILLYSYFVCSNDDISFLNGKLTKRF